MRLQSFSWIKLLLMNSYFVLKIGGGLSQPIRKW